MVATCFESDTGFQKGRNKGLEAVLNKDTRCAKYLALFSDLQLKKGLKGRNEDEVQVLVNQVVGLFAHLTLAKFLALFGSYFLSPFTSFTGC